ncbi:putative addiction module antidote protein [Campylobacterota bacterium]|nr:putative addiction module antidote protein [Campylobacterota bacterium]
MKKLQLTEWNVLDYLGGEEDIAAYLQAAADENDINYFLQAVGTVAKARSINDMAQKMGVSRESLYKSFSGKTKPHFETVIKALDALGLRFYIAPKTQAA